MSRTPGLEQSVVVIYDLDTEGHHAGYILHLIRHFRESGRAGRLVIASVPRMLEDHADLAHAIEETDRVSFHPVRLRGSRFVPQKMQLPANALLAWAALRHVCKRVGATHAMLMYADALLQVPIALGLPAPCPVSGIYFRPVFHYGDVSPLPINAQEKNRGRRQKYLLRRAMQHRDLATLFTLDSFAVPRLNTLGPNSQARWLPDPVDASTNGARAQRRVELGVAEHETLLLLFGVLSSRKGVREVLDAMRLLPVDRRHSLVLCLVGPVHSSTAQYIADARDALGGSLRVRDGFVAESDVQSYFNAADIVLAPYPRHVGMSAVLVRAAAAERPIIASAFGLLGALVVDQKLGLAVDAREPAAIAEAILDLVQGAPDIVSTENMRQLANSHRTELFASAILDRTFQ